RKGGFASDVAAAVMSPGKHPPEGAQNRTLTPAIGRAAATHSTHALDETPHDGEEQIQLQNPPNHPPHRRAASSLSGGPILLSMDPTEGTWCLAGFQLAKPCSGSPALPWHQTASVGAPCSN